MIKGYKDDLFWAKEVEKEVLEGHTLSQAMQKVMYKRDEYNTRMKGIAATIQIKEMNIRDMMQLHRQEVDELFRAYLENDIENLKEEILDVFQTLVNLVVFLGIDLEEELIRHRIKLENRGWKFQDNIILIL